ncbi:MAG: hypothetical protein ABI644_06745 [Arenimonas sp.]
MLQWLTRIFGRKPKTVSTRDEVHFSEEGIYYLSWMSRSQQWPTLWPWPVVLEFGLSFHQAIYPDPWFGNYMEAEWFFTVDHDGNPQRIFFDVDYFSIDELPVILNEKLSGFDKAALKEGWKEYRAGLRNFKGEGQWPAWRNKDFVWPEYLAPDTSET